QRQSQRCLQTGPRQGDVWYSDHDRKGPPIDHFFAFRHVVTDRMKSRSLLPHQGTVGLRDLWNRRALIEHLSDTRRLPLAAAQRIPSRNPSTTFQWGDASCRPAKAIREPNPGPRFLGGPQLTVKASSTERRSDRERT